jgi:hypothetical protein
MLCALEQSPQNVVYLHGIHADRIQAQALQPVPPRRSLLCQAVAEHNSPLQGKDYSWLKSIEALNGDRASCF